MTDREKVISEFEDFVKSFSKRDDTYYKGLFVSVLALLKEQDAVEPKQVIRKQCKTEHSDGSIDYYAKWFCPHCNSLLKRGFDAAWIEYCFKCGKPISWEGR